ncbi:MAG: S-layer homology domain-containing protein [Oscillospiraceae bacterium]
MKLKRFLSISLCLTLLAASLTVSAFAADMDKTLTLRENWRLTSDLDLNVPEGTTLTIEGNGNHIYEMGGRLLNSGLGTVTFTNATILYPAAGDTDAANVTSDGKWDANESDALMQVRQPHTVTIDSNIANGSVTANASTAKMGDTVTLTVAPASGYELDTLTVTDAASNTVEVRNNQFTMPAAGVTVTATFKATTPTDPDPTDPDPTDPDPTDPDPTDPDPTEPDPTEPDPTPTIPDPGPSNITTTTETNPDGSTTTTTTNRVTGTVTASTKNTDGSTLVVVTEKDGTVTTTYTAANGVQVVTVDKPGADVTVAVTVPKTVGEATVTIPAAVTTGTVAVNAETGEIIKLSVPTEGGLTVRLDSSVKLVLIDNSKDFVDTADHWAEEAIDFVTARGIFNGTSTTEAVFSPEEPMTRAMLMTVLARFDGEGTVGGSTWYEQGMNWAMANGISDGSDPEGNITREQLVTMLWRYSGSPAAAGDMERFPDADKVSDYAEEAMRWAVKTGLIGGMDDGTLNPHGSATRAMVATILMRFCGNLVK